MQSTGSLTFLDLFCGCGGFSLGMERAGFRCLAAIDFNREAVETFRVNFEEIVPRDKVLERDLTLFPPAELAHMIGTRTVDVITGGPPCQGFSAARKVDGSNHGEKLKDDPRRSLFREYLKFVAYFQPRVFVMENVLGLQTAAGGAYFTKVQHEARVLGYRVIAQVTDAYKLGVPQKRRRQLIIGVRDDLPGFFPSDLAPAPRATLCATLGVAIGDLPAIAAGEGEDHCEYDLKRRKEHLSEWGPIARSYLSDVLEVSDSPFLTAHKARPHSERDLRDFTLLREGESSAQAMRRGVRFEWPYSKDHFKDRYTRQSRHKPCSTIVAHLSKDGLMFIHPTQNRSLTPREAARVQTFPDWFWFPVARTHQFRLIGNAVPPLVSEAVGIEINAFLRGRIPKSSNHRANPQMREISFIPASQKDAAERLQEIARLNARELRNCSKECFMRGWFALFYLFPGLHPDNALDHGCDETDWGVEQPALPGLEAVARKRFARSGWPVVLEPLGREAWRRYEGMEIADDELYCAEAQRAGLQVCGTLALENTLDHRNGT